MVKTYKFAYKNRKVKYSHHSHKELGGYTAVTIGKAKYISPRASKESIKRFIDTAVNPNVTKKKYRKIR